MKVEVFLESHSSGNHKGGRYKGVRCDFDLGPKYGQISNGHNSSPFALEQKVFLSIYLLSAKLNDLDILRKEKKNKIETALDKYD